MIYIYIYFFFEKKTRDISEKRERNCAPVNAPPFSQSRKKKTLAPCPVLYKSSLEGSVVFHTLWGGGGRIPRDTSHVPSPARATRPAKL